LKKRGVAIVYVSHRLNEIFEICDDITVLRDGVTAFCSKVSETTQQEIVAQMIGKEIEVLYPKMEAEIGETVFEVQHLSDGDTVKDLSLQVHRGEILGLYGLVGSGATECPESLFGIVKHTSGRFFMKGREIRLGNPAAAVKNNIAYVPPDRHRQGVIKQLSIKFNLTLAVVRRLCKAGFIQKDRERPMVDEYVKKLRVKCAGDAQKVTFLSGGNQQKIVIAKWLAANPELLILNDPTRGVDVGAKAEIYALISELACAGLAIIITSSEIGEILGMSDRILVLNGGRVSREFTRGEANQKALLSAALVSGEEEQGGAADAE
ncbi:MAG: sugar ABC transporter ATP-binding protein, partial [Oscillospiraceae bacterium]|nr:sugar ABC transporter ATP-binding protein [Oscillospiraceae bacterium]